MHCTQRFYLRTCTVRTCTVHNGFISKIQNYAHLTCIKFHNKEIKLYNYKPQYEQDGKNQENPGKYIVQYSNVHTVLYSTVMYIQKAKTRINRKCYNHPGSTGKLIVRLGNILFKSCGWEELSSLPPTHKQSMMRRNSCTALNQI